MRLSKFNTYLNVSNRIGCVYNAISDKTVVFLGNAKEIEQQKNVPSNLYSRFQECGMVVKDETDEYSQFVDWAKEIEKDERSFHLIINPTLNCNFHCSYCYESHFTSKLEDETLSRVEKLVIKQLRDGKDLIISFFGGEPLLYYNDIMKPLIMFAKEKVESYGRTFSCNMTSNGYLLNEERVIWLSGHSFTNAQITLDGSREIHNKIRYRFVGDNTYDKIVENIKLLVQHGISVTLRLNCTNSNISSLSDIAPSFEDLSEDEKKRIMVDTQIVWQEETRNVLKDRMDTVVSSFLNSGIPASKMDFRGFCYADRRNSCLVNFNGDVYKCTARDFSTVPRDGFINEEGDVVWENDSLNKRMEAKFKNPHCRGCRIFPLCHGGCSTNSLENHDYCMHNFSEEEKDRAVKDRIVRNSTISRE